MQKEKSKYTSLAEWKKADPSAYATAQANGLLDKICEHFGWEKPKKRSKKGYWTFDKCKDIALKYNTRTEWSKKHYISYNIARKNGWIDECCKHMIVKIRDNWTLEECKKEALKHNSKKDWRYNGVGYPAALKNGWIDECCKHMIELRKRRDIEFCKKLASNYNDFYKWRKENSQTHQIIIKNGWLDECCAHMKKGRKPVGYWTLEKCKEEALKHDTRGKWQKKHSTSYAIAMRNKWLDECCKHMKKIRAKRKV